MDLWTVSTTRGGSAMKLNPLSWFSDWAGKLGVPVYVVWVAVIIVGYLVLYWLGIFRGP